MFRRFPCSKDQTRSGETSSERRSQRVVAHLQADGATRSGLPDRHRRRAGRAPAVGFASGQVQDMDLRLWHRRCRRIGAVGCRCEPDDGAWSTATGNGLPWRLAQRRRPCWTRSGSSAEQAPPWTRDGSSTPARTSGVEVRPRRPQRRPHISVGTLSRAKKSTSVAHVPRSVLRLHSRRLFRRQTQAARESDRTAA